MSAHFKIYLEDTDELSDLREWMDGLSGVGVGAVSRPPAPNAQGSVWDFLSVLCASAGPVAAAMRALQLWIESRVTVMRIEVGDKSFLVRSSDAETVLKQVEKLATKMLDVQEAHTDDIS